jgi:hypothetical protein
MGPTADANVRRSGHSGEVTLSERIESQSFAYDAEFPPDVAAGLPLSSACHRAQQQPPLKRALRVCKRAVISRKQR